MFVKRNREASAFCERNHHPFIKALRYLLAKISEYDDIYPERESFAIIRTKTAGSIHSFNQFIISDPTSITVGGFIISAQPQPILRNVRRILISSNPYLINQCYRDRHAEE